MRNKEDWEILYALATNEGMKKKDARYEQAYDNIVNLFYEKDKQIDLMANCILAREIGKMTCQFNEKCTKYENGRDIHCKDCIKQYFADKAKIEQ